MASFVSGLLAAVLFFVPLLCPFLVALSVGFAVSARGSKKQRIGAVAGLALSIVGVILHVWIGHFRHLL